MTRTKTILGISFAAVFVFSMVLIPAYAGGHVVIDKTDVKLKDLKISKVTIKLSAKIPKDGSFGAFGYGIFTTDGFDNVLALTTHKGIDDHSSQGGDASNPVFHAHVLDLAPATTCVGFDAQVLPSSLGNSGFDADYKVKVKNTKISVSKITPEDIGDGITSIKAFLIDASSFPGELCLTIISEQP